MTNLRRLAMSLGLAGLLGSTNVQAGDDTGLCEEGKRNTTVVTDMTYQREVLDYDGHVVVLHYGSQADTLSIQNGNDNAKKTFDELANGYCGIEADGKPIKFALLDATHRSYMKAAGNIADVLTGKKWDVEAYPTTQLISYGEITDEREGGAKDPTKIPGNVKVMSAWIDSNLRGIPFQYKGQDTRVVFDSKFGYELRPL